MNNWEEWDEVDTIVVKQQETPERKNEPKVMVRPPNEDGFLSDSALRAAHPFYESQPSKKILSRNNPSENSIAPPTNLTPPQQQNSSKSLADRERDYQEARRRILGDSVTNSPSISSQTSTTTTTATTTTIAPSNRSKNQQGISQDELADYSRKPKRSQSPQTNYN